MLTIYILLLEKGKYYVGKTNNFQNRIQQHVNKQACVWTKKYPYVDVYKSYTNCDTYDEDKYTLQMMSQFGIDNVRGGSFSNINLSCNTKRHIIHMIRSSENKCFNCGGNHFVSNCKDTLFSRIKKKFCFTSYEEIPTLLTSYDPDNELVNFGRKHIGKRFIDVYSNDRKYVEWVLKQDETTETKNNFIDFKHYCILRDSNTFS